ncbi:DUF3696 domain-containing protein [Flavobacteriales bacterium]|nr:DUF3696 domain-containing protein [Flavobacteriales bacterium]
MGYIFENLYIKNFKGFRESTAIKIADINLLTGKNNAGKSSLIELIEILSLSMSNNGITKLKFSSLQKFLSFDKALNYESKTKEIVLTFPSTLKYFGKENLFHIRFTFEKSIINPLDGFLKSIKYLHITIDSKNKENEELIFEIKDNQIIKSPREEEQEGGELPTAKFFCNLPFIFNHVRQQLKSSFDKKKDDLDPTKWKEVTIGGKVVYVEKDSEEKIENQERFHELMASLPTYNDYKTEFYDDKYENVEFFNSTSQTIDYYDYGVFINEHMKDDKEYGFSIYDYKNIYESNNEYFDKIAQKRHQELEGSFNLSGTMHYRVNDINFESLASHSVIHEFWDHLNNKLDEEGLTKIHFIDHSPKSLFGKLIFESIVVEFIKPLIIYNNNSQKPTIVDITRDNNLDFLLKSLYNKNLHKESIEYSFLNFWLNEFGYGSSFKLIEEDKKISILFNENKRIDSFGRGLQSLLKTLISITSKAEDNFGRSIKSPHYSSSILILIEPESNLHPDLQSKLADLIIDANNKFSIQFIIETHSEYLIRKLQYWTSIGKINPEQTILNYFDKDQLKKTIKINQITIDKTGNLSDNLGEGFIDHAPKLMLDLLNLKKKNNLN